MLKLLVRTPCVFVRLSKHGIISVFSVCQTRSQTDFLPNYLIINCLPCVINICYQLLFVCFVITLSFRLYISLNNLQNVISLLKWQVIGFWHNLSRNRHCRCNHNSRYIAVSKPQTTDSINCQHAFGNQTITRLGANL